MGYRYRQIPVPDDGPDDDRRTLSLSSFKQTPDGDADVYFRRLENFIVLCRRLF